MMNYFDVIKAQSGVPVEDIWAQLWGMNLSTSEYQITEIEGTPPLTFTANGRNLINYRIYGANDGVGERTENLFDFNRQQSDTFVLDPTKYIYGARGDKPTPEPQYITEFVYNSDSFTVLTTGGAGIGFLVEVKPNTTYTISYQCDAVVPANRTSVVLNLITSDGTFGTFWTLYGDDRVSTFTTNANTTYVYLVFRVYKLRATYSNIMLTEGSTAPAQYIPYGYQINAVVRSENLFALSAYSSAALINCTIAVIDDILTQTNSGTLARSAWKIDGLQVGADYTMSTTINNPDKTECQIRICDSTNLMIITRSTASKETSTTLSVTFTAQTTTHYVRLYSNTSTTTANTYSAEFSEIMLNLGSTVLPYQPYSRTDIPIYIGDTPLEDGEYVDYGEQKIYKDISGVLTPVDPTDAIPNLPTIDGVTIIDFDNEPKPDKIWLRGKIKEVP